MSESRYFSRRNNYRLCARNRSVKVNRRRNFEGNDGQFATGENGQARSMKVKRWNASNGAYRRWRHNREERIIDRWTCERWSVAAAVSGTNDYIRTIPLRKGNVIAHVKLLQELRSASPFFFLLYVTNCNANPT